VYGPQNIIREIKLGKRLAMHVAHMGEIRYGYSIWLVNLKVRKRLENRH